MPIIRSSYDIRLKVDHSTSDQAVNNSTVMVQSQLGVPVRLSSTYLINAVIRGSSNVLADWKFSIRGPAGCSGFFTAVSQNTGVGPTTAIGSDATLNSIGGDEVIVLWGLMLTAGAAGEAQLWFAQNAAHASDTTVVQNSMISSLKV